MSRFKNSVFRMSSVKKSKKIEWRTDCTLVVRHDGHSKFPCFVRFADLLLARSRGHKGRHTGHEAHNTGAGLARVRGGLLLTEAHVDCRAITHDIVCPNSNPP